MWGVTGSERFRDIWKTTPPAVPFVLSAYYNGLSREPRSRVQARERNLIMTKFSHVIIRRPGKSLCNGITSAPELGQPI